MVITPVQGPICRGGVGGFNPPNDFFDPESPSIWAPGGSILTPVLVLHVSAYGASTLSPGGDPPVFFYKSNTAPV